MKPYLVNLFVLSVLFLTSSVSVTGQTKKACDLVSVEQLNKLLSTNLIYDKNSIINRNGKFECRYTDSKLPGTYIAIGLLSSKIQYGYDLLETDFKSNKQSITSGSKAGGKFTKFVAFPAGGGNAFYMTAEKTDFSAEAYVLKFRNGEYIITVSSENIPVQLLIAKTSEIYRLFGKL